MGIPFDPERRKLENKHIWF